MMQRVGPCLVCGSIFLNALILLLPTPVQAQNDDPGHAQLMFMEDEEIQYADVRPGEHSTITFPGVVTENIAADMPHRTVHLFGRSSLDWLVTIRPQTLEITPGNDEVPFSATVLVPFDTSSIIEDTLTIYGYTKIYPGIGSYSIKPLNGSIFVNQFYMLTMDCPKKIKSVRPTEELAFLIYIWNRGNGRDTTNLSIKNIKVLNEKGFTIQFSQDNIEIDEKSMKSTQVQIKSPIDEYEGTYKIVVEASNNYSFKNPQITLYVNIVPYSTCMFSISLGSLFITISLIITLIRK